MVRTMKMMMMKRRKRRRNNLKSFHAQLKPILKH